MVLLAAIFQPVPGYMDAEYYYAGGLRLADGSGFTEPFLWNYLNDLVELPAPSHLYWMPLPSILAAGGMKLLHSSGYFAARLLFLLMASVLPPFAAWFAWRLTKRERASLLAGALAAFSGFYAIYTGLAETITLYMLLGGVFILLAYEVEWKWLECGPVPLRYVLLGLLAGLMHMTRADGLLWLGAAVLLAFWWGHMQPDQRFSAFMRRSLILLLFCVGGYALVTFPWYLRNLGLFGSMLPPGNGRAMWITTYDQTFSYPASVLTIDHWLSAGLGEHLRVRGEALGANLATALGVEGEFFLSPLMITGLWRLRRHARVKLGVGLWGMTFLVMTLVFPYAGARGGFLHSGAAFQLLLWAAAPEGLLAFVEWGARTRGWKKKRSEKVFGLMTVGLALVLTFGIFYARVIHPTEGGWDAGYAAYQKIDRALDGFGAGADRLVMVNNPPGYYLSSGHAAIVIPDGDIQTLLAAARRYQADYVVLEKSLVAGLAPLFANPVSQPGLKYLGMADGAEFFKVEP